MRSSKLNVLKWVAILPGIAKLVGEVVDALKDGRVTPEEITRIGEDLVALVASVTETA